MARAVREGWRGPPGPARVVAHGRGGAQLSRGALSHGALLLPAPVRRADRRAPRTHAAARFTRPGRPRVGAPRVRRCDSPPRSGRARHHPQGAARAAARGGARRGASRVEQNGLARPRTGAAERVGSGLSAGRLTILTLPSAPAPTTLPRIWLSQ